MARNLTKLSLWLLFVLLPAVEAWAADQGAVYAMTNALGNNQVVVYHRAVDGTLSYKATVATGGGGSGVQLSEPIDSLGSQGGLVLDKAHRTLFAVNTETLAANSPDCQEGTITSFHVAADGTLTVADRVTSRGLYPDSLTVTGTKDRELLYVLNAGGPNQLNPAGTAVSPKSCGIGPRIVGFEVNRAGEMRFLPGSEQPIDPGPTGGGTDVNCDVGGFPVPGANCGLNPPAFPRSPAQVGFTPSGSQLVVTIKGTNSIDVFRVREDGTAASPSVTQAPGPALPTYFGFAFDRRNHLILTEAFGASPSIPAKGAGAVSSFKISRHDPGSLRQVSASVGDQGTATCWVAIDPTGRYAYVSNNLSNNISSYSIANNGTLTLLAATAASANGPNDIAAVGEYGAGFLYVLLSGDGTVGAFQINLDGSLTSLGPIGGLPVNAGAQGLAAY